MGKVNRCFKNNFARLNVCNKILYNEIWILEIKMINKDGVL